MKTNLSSAYKKLTYQERLALIVEAMARGDKTEVLRLWNTAPVHTLKGVHPALSECYKELEYLACAMVISLQGICAAFYAAFLLHMNRDSFSQGWLEAGGKAKALAKWQKAQEPDSEEIAETVLARAQEAFTLACAYDEACKQIGFSRDTLVRAFVSPFHAEQLKLDLPIMQHFAQGEVDEQLKDETLAAIRSRCPRIFKPAPKPGVE